MFQDAGLTDLSGPPSSSQREYTVQFNETDLHFATRLMEEEGWFYFFEHTSSKHTLVIANQNRHVQGHRRTPTMHLGRRRQRCGAADGLQPRRRRPRAAR